MRALVAADVPRPKEIFVRLAGATDELADQLAEIAHEVGCPPFSIDGDELVTWAKVHGNPWDTHDVLAALAALSRRVSLRTFSVVLDPDGTAGALRDGKLTGIAFAPLAAWVTAHPRPRHAAADVRAGLRVRGVDEVELAGLDATASQVAGELAIEVARTDHIAPAVRRVVQGVAFLDEPWRVELTLTGGIAWRHAFARFIEGVELEQLIGTLLADVPRPQTLPPPPIALPRSPELAAFAPDLALEELDGTLLAPGPDGEFAPVARAPSLWSSDRRFAVRWSGPELVEWIDVAAGVTRDVHAAPAPYSRRPLGFAGDALVLIETDLELGRIRSRLVVHPPDGHERTSRAFVNPSAIGIVDERTVALDAERDGTAELLAIELATWSETRLRAGDPVRPSEILGHAGATLGILGTRDATTIVRYPSAEPLHALAGALERVHRDGDVLWILTSEHDDGQRFVTHLHRVGLADGRVATHELGRARTDLYRFAGAWLAWYGRDLRAIRRFEHGEPRGELAIPAGYRWDDVALAPDGALAVTFTGDDTVLEVWRGERHLRVALPEPLGLRFNEAARS